MKICIVCQKDVEGKPAIPIKEDTIIRTIRGVKQFFHIAANNELYVCEEDIPAQQERRKSFERSLIFFGVLAAIVVILLIGNMLFLGRFDLFAFISAFIIGFFILLFAVVFKYAPAVEKMPSLVGKHPLSPELEVLEDKEEKPKESKKARKR